MLTTLSADGRGRIAMPRQGVEVTVYIASDGAWPGLTVLKRCAELIPGTVTMT